VKSVKVDKELLALKLDTTIFSIWRGRKMYKLTNDDSFKIDVNPDGVLFFRYEK
jgi:hypothetical protein